MLDIQTAELLVDALPGFSNETEHPTRKVIGTAGRRILAARARTSGGMGTRLGCRGADSCSALRLLRACINVSTPRMLASCLALSSLLIMSPFCTCHHSVAFVLPASQVEAPSTPAV